MRKLVAYTFVSLDDYMSGKNGKEMEFVTKNWVKEMDKDIASEYKNTDTFLMGGTTYNELSQYWPNVTTKDEPLADFMDEMEKIVFSSTLKKLKWNNSKLSNKDLFEKVKELKKSKGKNIMIIGSASIVQQLTERKLIDEYQFLLFPILTGGGKRLFKTQKEELKLKMANSKTYKNGTMILTYTNG